MQCASDPFNGELIDVAEYIRRHGQRGAGDDTRPACHCEVCCQVMRPRGELTPNSHAHFAHLRGAAQCPTQSRTGEPYLALTPVDPDPARALVRGSYRAPPGRRLRPGLEDLLKTSAHEVTPALAVGREPPIGAGLAEWFEQILRKHLP